MLKAFDPKGQRDYSLRTIDNGYWLENAMVESCLKEAVLWEAMTQGRVKCGLCRHACVIAEGKTGFCAVRKNVNGVLYSLNYAMLCAANADPIEKKPLFHFLPGSQSFSIAAEGCNFRCEFCQNWQISQNPWDTGSIRGQRTEPEAIVQAALLANCSSIAYTYTEPTVFMELCAACARLARAQGMANVFVSNGYETVVALDQAKDWLDGINVDLKAFDPNYYTRLCKARFEGVLDTIRYIAQHTDIWMEITTLLVPGQNDGEDELKQLAEFIATEAGPAVPWHVSRFHPQYKLSGLRSTPIEKLERAYAIGKEAGLDYVYLGNVPGSDTESTFCPQCQRILIERHGYRILGNELVNGRCPDCAREIAGVW